MFELRALTQVAFLLLKLSATELDRWVSGPRVLGPRVLGPVFLVSQNFKLNSLLSSSYTMH